MKQCSRRWPWDSPVVTAMGWTTVNHRCSLEEGHAGRHVCQCSVTPHPNRPVWALAADLP